MMTEISTKLSETFDVWKSSCQETMTVSTTSWFTSAGTLTVTDGTNSTVISYTGKTSTTFIDCEYVSGDTDITYASGCTVTGTKQSAPEFPTPTTLFSPFLSTDTSIVLADVSNIPEAPNEICIDAEQPLYITYTGISGNTLTGVTRNDGSYSGDVSSGVTVARYVNMRDRSDAISKSSAPNSERLAGVASLLGWNDMMTYWVNSIQEYDSETGELTGNKIYTKEDGTIIRFDSDAQALYTKKEERYNISRNNNRRVIWE